MNIVQVEQYHKAILRNAREWADGTGLPLYQEDILVLGDYFNMNIPAAFYKFESADSPGEFRATGGYKTISKTLGRIQKKLQGGALNKYIDDEKQEDVNDMDKRDKEFKNMKQRLAQCYAAYIQTLHSYSGDGLIERAAEIAAAKAVYNSVKDIEFDAKLLEALAQHENPLKALQEGWLKYHDQSLHSIEMARILELIADTPDVKMLGLPSGIDPTPALEHKAGDPVSIEELFKKKLESNYENIAREWLRLDPAYLIERTSEITFSKQLYHILREAPSEHQEYLLRFQRPLEVVFDLWSSGYELDSLGGVAQSEIEILVNDMMRMYDDQEHAGDAKYSLDPDYINHQDGQGVGMALTQ